MGDAGKLNKFLELNPAVPRSLCYVDDSKNFEAYATAGFGNIGSLVPEMKIQPPNFKDFGMWLKYLANVMSLAPVDPATGNTEGVLKLGGTFVLQGNRILYAFAEPVPGQHAPLDEVLAAAGAM